MSNERTPSTDSAPDSSGEGAERRNFVQARIDADLAAGRFARPLRFRFPPEPNGYPHIGHAKAICLNFGLADEFEGAACNLRFDDTNPAKEEMEYVVAIRDDIRWLGFEWGEELFASSYFEELYQWACRLIEKGAAYVCDLSLEDAREQRGYGNRPGTNSPFRERSVAENLDLFARMRAGEFAEGERTLRAKIDMAHTNLQMRDPVMYRILHRHHHQTGDAWKIYPTYDWAHGQSDAIEGITHSLCSLEFENHRPLYEWYLEQLGVEQPPEQIEFARLQLTHTFTAKRKLVELVAGGHVSGWDDPRMPTLRGMRRRGYTPSVVREFCKQVGVARFNSTIDMVVLENTLREELNRTAERRMAVLDPLEVVIENLPEDHAESIDAVNNPGDESAGTRAVPLTRRIFIERDDFMEDPPNKFFRLGPGREVRLRYAYCITCTEVVKDADGRVVRLVCTYDPESGGGKTSDGRKVKGVIHWVPADQALRADVRLYDHLLAEHEAPETADDEADWKTALNPDSLVIARDAALEPSLAEAAPGTTYQFERIGYFTADSVDSQPGAPVFHRSVALRDTWAKQAQGKGH
jgi:glutaminyl-tRNA synthetase